MIDVKSEWELMKAGSFLYAYKLLSEHIAASDSSKYLYLYNRALCLLNLNRPREALADFLEFISERPEAASGYLGAGISFWWLQETSNALLFWEKALTTKYRDIGNGIEPPLLLFFAAIKLGDSKLEKKSVNLIRKISNTRFASKWPSAIGAYLLGKIDIPLFYQLASSGSSSIADRKLCKYYFYLAVNNLRDKNNEEYLRYLTLSVNTNSILESEYYLAKHEISRTE